MKECDYFLTGTCAAKDDTAHDHAPTPLYRVDADGSVHLVVPTPEAVERVALDALQGISWQAGSSPSVQVLASIKRRADEAIAALAALRAP